MDTVHAAARPYYPILDGMRGLAAIAVVILHLTTIFAVGGRPAHAHLAVDMFFMLSGLVIANTYEARLAGGLTLRRFLSLRLLRLYPLTLLGAAAGAVVLLGAWASDRDLGFNTVVLSIVCSAVLIPSPFLLSFRAWAFPGNSPLWSLSVEFVVNAAYGLTLHRLRLRTLLGAVALGAVAILAIALRRDGLDVGFAWRDYPLGLARAAGSFLGGVLIYRLARRSGSLAPWANITPFVMLGVLLAPLARSGVYDAFVVIGFFPAALAVAMRGRPAAGLDRLWKTLGAYSYPLYVVHYPVIVILARVAKPLQSSPVTSWLTMAGAAAAVALCAYLAQRFYDLPARRLVADMFSARSRAAGPPPPPARFRKPTRLSVWGAARR